MTQILKIFILFFISSNLFAQPPANADKYLGDWEGAIELPNSAELGVIFQIGGSVSALNCTMEVPAQGASKVPADKIYFEGDQLYIDYAKLRANYSGKLENGVIKGTWVQNGMEFPLDLSPFTEW